VKLFFYCLNLGMHLLSLGQNVFATDK